MTEPQIDSEAEQTEAAEPGGEGLTGAQQSPVDLPPTLVEQIERVVRLELQAESEGRMLRAVNIGLAKGLPGPLAMRLRGATDADLAADADQLVRWMVEQATSHVAGFKLGVHRGVGGSPS